MGLELKQNLKLSQQLVITPQLQQAIKLLQLSHLDLVDQIQQELVENPALEEVPGAQHDEGMVESLQRYEEAGRTLANDLSEQNNGEKVQNALDTEARARTEKEWAELLDQLSNTRSGATGSGQAMGDDELTPIEATLTRPEGLVEHLAFQLRMQMCTDDERKAAQVILMNLDDRGWLTIPIEEVASEAEVDIDDAEGAQMIVQALDPIGCGSLNLEECLVVQARLKYPDDPFIERVIWGHLADFEKRNYASAARVLDMDVEDVVEYHKMIQELEPWPGRNFGEDEARHITPDVYVFKSNGVWQVNLNEDGMPKLRISNYYRTILQQASNRDEKDYVKDRLEKADFLIQSIFKRQNTISKVVRSILDRQIDFFEHGVEYLRPMILRDVADEIGVHESTVSRVTSNKYLECPWGIFELKFFFKSGLSAAGGEDLASEAVKAKIRHMIASETPKAPLSDQEIADLLDRQGISCARRTVAKYREAMGILPSSKRRNVF